MKKQSDKKLFILQKMVMASTVKEAIKMDGKTPVHECWIDNNWKEGKNNQLASAIGFITYPED